MVDQARDVPFLRLRGLGVRFSYRGRWGRRCSFSAVEDIDLCLRDGSSLALIGETGCGKSTLLRTLLGLQAFHEGTMEHEGRPIRRVGDAVHRRALEQMQTVFQHPVRSLNPRLSLRASLEEPLRARGMEAGRRRHRVDELVAELDLPTALLDRRPAEASGGQNQRVCLARALATGPRFLLLDEPLSALDGPGRSELAACLLRLQKSHRLTYVLVTHDLPLARLLASHVAVMYLGWIVEWAPADRLFAHPRHPYARALVSSVLRPGFWAGDPIVLRGDPPSSLHRPSGCPFHPRCPLAQPRCAQRRPPLRSVDEEWWVRCPVVAV